MSQWQLAPGQESATVLKSPRGDFPDSAVPVQTYPSHWRRLFPPANEVLSTDRIDESRLDVSIGHFTIERRIGAGAMGAVFLAHDERLHRDVALKVLAPTQAADPSTVLRFQHEAQAAARLDHDHIARVFYSGEERGLHFIAYEYVAGTNLRDLLRQRGRLSPVEAVNYAIQIATALRHTSRHGVIHRDIKPSNIIVTPFGRAKLVDLGLAKRDSLETGGELTVAGTTLGTFDYISPEQARDPRTVDVRSDIYSLGCTLYHLLTGEPPYPEGTVLQKLLDHQAHGAPDVSSKNRRVSPALSAVVRKMMASDLSQRYASPDELLRDLAVIAQTLGLRMVSPDSAALVPAGKLQGNWLDRNFGWVLMTAILLLIVAGLQTIPPDIRDRIALIIRGTAPPAGTTGIAKERGSTNPPPIVPEKPPRTQQDSPTATIRLPEPNSDPRATMLESFEPVSAASAVLTAATSNPITPAPTEEKPPEISIVGAKHAYQTLEQACQEAKDGAIIELAFHGARPLKEQTLRLNNKKLIVRAARGFSPRLDFTDEVRQANASARIVVTGGSLQLINLDLVAKVGESASGEPWSLFALERPESLKLDGVTVTVLNPKRRQASVVELTGTISSSGMPMPKIGFTTLSPEILLQSCVIRGAASLLTVRDALAARCVIEKSIVALEESLLAIQARPTMNGGDPGSFKMELSHATVVLNGSLIISKRDDDFSENELPVVVVAQNNLISVGQEQPLVDLSVGEEMDYREMFAWSRERNFYHDVKAFWTIRTRQNGSPQPLNFTAWKEYWKSDLTGTENSPIQWASNIRSTSPQDLKLADVTLSTAGGPNRAIRGATDGTDLGAPIDQLRMPPRLDSK